MSILIRGMEMPKHCLECKCTWIDDDYNKVCCFTDVVALSIGRQDNCPLIELPPHGRLIDATFEENHYASMILDPTPDVTREDKHKARIILDALQMAKTVIEAEGSET